ncbi:LuxR C-terminal-related transcriptional regulator [Azospirillum canadense]|uniref:LuxR C-terminal-related transcriptional regulator n=1 Tax=Azospirillum canadense TaxID=403962 RepID=UPI0022266319|nr:response regulator transcription factor [Azospirillum canadense]MCW2239574.1 two-component system nitrate/nitrite response regulator NarL [Azospirillum canadense]
MKTVSVALIDESRLFREAIKALLRNSEFHIASEALSVEKARLFLAAETPPALILIDTSDAKDLAAIKETCPGTQVVLLTTQIDCPGMASAIAADADGILIKDMSSDALLQSLRLVMMGEKVFPSHLPALLLGGRVLSGVKLDAPKLGKALSERELQILQGLLNGGSNKEIALGLGITEATVKVHLKSVLRKINVSNRTQAAIWALEHGLGDGMPASLEVA